MIDYEIFSKISKLPKKKNKITVIRLCKEEEYKKGILVQDFQNGKFKGKKAFFGICDVEDKILNYKFRDEVWVEYIAEVAFDCIWGFAELYRKNDGDLEKICEILEDREICDFSEEDSKSFEEKYNNSPWQISEDFDDFDDFD